ncbi:MarR family winged helix-turn-helix transcriptional regulator [Candidatus Manganitrophus noduliformans]|uniref:MarR family transcriptional regulator n=1 Tax=Candidatus Manganitrophus noduliformans TaxID=2606439 RepID=A0A7X6I967_9BACT|nr:MarR family transcriptional regulator [Candidatus Manganitrophus noduliformans]NKE69371.1 MarR family transcriptional regulator [Candidatus Manganitrophus noduliformans]
MGTHYRGTREEVTALDTFIKLMRAADSLSSRLSPILASTGLTSGQFGALEVLLHLGPLCQSELGRKLLRSGGNITMVVDNLERSGLVRRERGEDRRFITLHLTKEGRQLIQKIFPKHLEALVREMQVLTESEQKALGRLCKKLGKGSDGEIRTGAGGKDATPPAPKEGKNDSNKHRYSTEQRAISDRDPLA